MVGVSERARTRARAEGVRAARAEPLRLLVPPHPEPLSTLIANGLIHLIGRAQPDAEVEVRRLGGAHAVEVRGAAVDWGEAHALLIDELSFVARVLREGCGALAEALAPWRQRLASALRGIAEVAPVERIEGEYADPEHASKEGWGRRRELQERYGYGGAPTALLFLAPWAGKRRGGGRYSVCPLCFSLAFAGLTRATAVITYREGRAAGAVFATPDPVSAGLIDAAQLQLAFGEARFELGREPPAEAAPLLALGGAALLPVEGEWAVCAWKLEYPRGGSPRVKELVRLRALRQFSLREGARASRSRR